jgi:hypothetical protein
LKIPNYKIEESGFTEPKYLKAFKNYSADKNFVKEIDASILLDLSKLYWFDNSSKLIAMG